MSQNGVFTVLTEVFVMSIFGSLAGKTPSELLKVGDPAPDAASVDRDGKIVWRDLCASTKEQAADILKVVAACK